MERKTVKNGCKYPAIEIKKKSGDEQFLNVGDDVYTLRDF
jgi:hypothetical protein